MPGRTADARPPNDTEYKETAIFALELDEASAKVRTGPPIDPDEDLDARRLGGRDPDPARRRRSATPAPDLKPGVDVPAYVTDYRRPGR